jgi:hypothetical protein
MGVPELGELVRQVARLPSGICDAEQFDLLLLALRVTVLRVKLR